MKHLFAIAAFTALSIAANPVAVKAQTSDLKDSVKDESGNLTKLAKALMVNGADVDYPDGFAQVVGLDKPEVAKAALIVSGGEGHKCHVVYEADESGSKRPICFYFVRAKKTTRDHQDRYLRVSLDGHLERAVTLRGKFDEQGKPIRSERSKVDEDIDSPEIQKIFKTELSLWLNDWLKKQNKIIAKSSKVAATPAKDPATAAASPETAQ